MKKIVSKLMVLGLVLGACAAMLLGTGAQAADRYGVENYTSPSGNAHVNWLTNHTAPSNTFAFLVPGSSTTNIPATQANIMPIPQTGFGTFLRTGGTNAADTTNLVIVLEGVIFPTGNRAGGTQVVDNATITISTPTTATAMPTGYDYLTNFTGQGVLSGTLIALTRCDGVRVRSIQNTNLNSIWVSNLFQLRDPAQ